MKPLRNINDLQIWAKSSDYRALSDNASIEIKLNYFGGVELGSPQDEATAVTTTPTLRWASYPGASEYKVRVWDYTGDTKGTQIVDDNTTDVEYTISSALSNSTKYLWQIAQIGPIDPISQPITVSVSGGSTLEQNGTRQLSVSTTNTNQGVTWSSQNEAIATVDSNGLVTYVSGAVDATVDIDATSVEDPTKSDTHTLTIVEEESGVTFQDSRAGDEAFMQAIWDSADGPNWNDNSGWNDGAMSLADDPYGLTIETVGGELRITGVKLDGDETINVGSLYDAAVPGGNNLSGGLPVEIGNLKKCWYFSVKQNNLTEELPDVFDEMVLCEWLYLSGTVQQDSTSPNVAKHRGKTDTTGNFFGGKFPTSIFDMPVIEYVDISGTNIQDEFPQNIGSSQTLFKFHCNYNAGLTGNVPSGIGNCTNLHAFYIANCGMDGSIPQDIENCPMRNIHVGRCNFDGTFPYCATWTEIRAIQLESQNGPGFTGDDMGQYISDTHSKLHTLGGSWSSFSFEMPDFSLLSNPAVPAVFTFGGQAFNNGGITGNASNIVAAYSLTNVALQRNELGGTLPETGWAAWDDCRFFWCHVNNLEGDIPSEEIINSSNLQRLNYGANEFTGIKHPENFLNISSSVFKDFIIANNRLTPKDLVPLLPMSTWGLENFNIGSQREFGSQDDLSGSTIDFSSFDYTDNTYKWFKNGVELSGETSHTLDTTPHGAGDFHMEIDHPDLTQTFKSTLITVT